MRRETRACDDADPTAATNRDLQTAVVAGTFREDLWYRLNVIEVVLAAPSEQRHSGDIPAAGRSPVAVFLASQASRACTVRTKRRAAALLVNTPGRSNVRELRNAIERCVILAQTDRRVKKASAICRAQIGAPRLPAGIAGAGRSGHARINSKTEHIRRVPWPTQRRWTIPAEQLGIDPSTLYRQAERGTEL